MEAYKIWEKMFFIWYNIQFETSEQCVSIIDSNALLHNQCKTATTDDNCLVKSLF